MYMCNNMGFHLDASPHHQQLIKTASCHHSESRHHSHQNELVCFRMAKKYIGDDDVEENFEFLLTQKVMDLIELIPPVGGRVALSAPNIAGWDALATAAESKKEEKAEEQEEYDFVINFIFNRIVTNKMVC